MTSSNGHLVWLRCLVEHPGINSCRHQVVGSCDGVNVTSQMEVKLKDKMRGEWKNDLRKERKELKAAVNMVVLQEPVEIL